MTDQAFIPLLKQLQSHADSKRPAALWLAGENHEPVIPELAGHRNCVTLVSNRFDIAQLARHYGIESVFSDWAVPPGLVFDSIFLRIGKEKAVTHHQLNIAFDRLPPGGRLFLTGYKDEGIKSCAQKAKALFDAPNALVKDGAVYCLELTKRDSELPPIRLDDQDYQTLRPVATPLTPAVLSKPGVYGWEKVDRGSVLLVETLMRTGELDVSRVDSLLDLGCGYGYLTLATNAFPVSRRTATDNNAGALACMKANADAFGISVEVVAADCGDLVDGFFDLILCNPPFHKGFDVDTDLHRKFLESSARKLSATGAAYFVVNSFLPLEKAARRFFNRIDCLNNDGQFKIIRLAVGTG